MEAAAKSAVPLSGPAKLKAAVAEKIIGKAKTLQALGRNKEALRAEQELQKLEQEREENLKKRPK